MKVFVSAFMPFNNESVNYSMEVLKHLEFVDKLVIDVIYDECFFQITNSVNLADYDLIIALGEARNRNELTLEVLAKNLSSSSICDNKKIKKINEIIDTYEKEVLKTNVDIKKCEDIVKFSYDAGSFVCNNLYFHLLKNYCDKAIFIHIPNCNEDENKYIEYAKIINKIIERLLKNSL